MKSDSAKAHRTFVILALLLCAGLATGLVFGWRWHGQEMQRLASLRQPTQTKPSTPALRKLSAQPVPPKARALPEPKEKEAGKPDTAISLLNALSDGELAESMDRQRITGLPSRDDIEALPLSENTPELKAALEILDGYWNAQTWQEKMAYVWDPARVGGKMRAYYAGNEGPEKQRGPLTAAGRYVINDNEILYFSHAGDRPLGAVEIGMRKTSEGTWKLDWESYTGIGEMTWQEFKNARPTDPVLMRVFAKTGDYHNFEFLDEQRYLPLQLYDESGESVAHAYCERDTALAAFLSNDIFRSGGSVKGYTLRLAFPPNAQSNHCVWLKEIVATRWLLDP